MASPRTAMEHAFEALQKGNEVPGWMQDVLKFMTVEDLFALRACNKTWAKISTVKSWAKWKCQLFANQFGLYCPEQLPSGETWEGFFEELVLAKGLWSDSPEDRKPLQDQRIRVFARLKPESSSTQETKTAQEDEEKKRERNESEGNDENEGEDEDRAESAPAKRNVRVVLPLHQRLSMIKLASKGKLDTKGAIRVLRQQGDWFSEQDLDEEQKKALNAETGEDEELPRQEFKFKVHVVNEDAGELVMSAPTIGLRSFRFNGVVPIAASQQEVYERVGRRLIIDVLNGLNATLFVYGQTGAGKTYTMYGPDDDAAAGNNYATSGLVPRLCNEVIGRLREREAKQNVKVNIYMSYVEIYGDTMSDLLRTGEQVGQSKVSAQRYVLSGEAKVEIQNECEIRQLLAEGEAVKRKAATKMNERSSRAHSVLILTVVQRRDSSDSEVVSKLFLGDLGGSERLSKSEATGVQATETKDINMGLLALKQVITSLNEGRSHVPYHNSKLTMLLSEGLGGNSRSHVVVCASPDPQHASETMQTFRFGEDCALIENKVENNVRIVADLLHDIDAQIEALEEDIKRKERWETVETRRADNFVETGTLEEAINQSGGELVRSSKLVGAEKEHLELEALHARRRELLGE
mmetsp:Transcript_3524/g.6813  ORF Transcript_3524/g.6813 Transcript_3524/m.6813 type:complete len:636 (+) Transcript_3524:1-1908(+)